MKKIVNKKICSGCHACSNACPKNCISMQPDKEGFLYPVIDKTKCTNCGKCKRVCSVLNTAKTNKGVAYACINKDENIRMQSSSGGIFTLIAENIINQGGVVYGAALCDDLSVKHIEVDNCDDLNKLRGSKYLQSTVGDSYTSVKKHLNEGRWVLFTGTPCQIGGLNSFLNNTYDRLITADMICHGVPSPKVWHKYLQYREQQAKGKINIEQKPQFRNKSTGWELYSVVLNFENNKKYSNKFTDDLYMRAFIGNISLRKSCYNCKSKSLSRESDITLADFWGIKKVHHDMFDDKGTSLVFVNSKKGETLFNNIKNQMKYCETDIENIPQYNISVCKSVEWHPNRNKFLKMIAEDVDFKESVDKCLKLSFFQRAWRFGKRRVKKYCKLLLNNAGKR